MSAAAVGRVVAAVAVVTAFLAIWLNAVGGDDASFTYWTDKTLGVVLLALACVAALAGAGALVLRHPVLDLTVGATGAILFGLYLFLPAAAAFSGWDVLARGTWLGVCSGMILIGAGLALSNWGQEPSAPDRAVLGVAALGWVFLIVGIWFDLDVDGGSYFSPQDSGHGLGVLFLILLGLWLMAALPGIQTRKAAPLALAAGVALVTFGLALWIPVTAAFGGLGDLRIGTWLPLGGAILLSVGSVLAIRLEAGARR